MCIFISRLRRVVCQNLLTCYLFAISVLSLLLVRVLVFSCEAVAVVPAALRKICPGCSKECASAFKKCPVEECRFAFPKRKKKMAIKKRSPFLSFLNQSLSLLLARLPNICYLSYTDPHSAAARTMASQKSTLRRNAAETCVEQSKQGGQSYA